MFSLKYFLQISENAVKGNKGSEMNIMLINSAKEWGGTEKWALYAADGLAGLGHRFISDVGATCFRIGP